MGNALAASVTQGSSRIHGSVNSNSLLFEKHVNMKRAMETRQTRIERLSRAADFEIRSSKREMRREGGAKKCHSLRSIKNNRMTSHRSSDVQRLFNVSIRNVARTGSLETRLRRRRGARSRG